MEIIIRGSPSDIALLWGLIRHQDDPLDEDDTPAKVVVRGFTDASEDRGEDCERGEVTH